MHALILIGQLALASLTAIDGDTLHDNRRQHNYRLHGVDTPEIGQAKCPAERRAGEAAKARVAAILAAAGRVEASPAWDPRGRKRWPTDGFGRRIATVSVDGADLGAMLVAEGHALPWDGKTHPDWCGPQTWDADEAAGR